MDWRKQSTFQRESKLATEEKDFLKLVKKYRDGKKLQERVDKGEELDPNQLEKLNQQDAIIQDLVAMAARLPGTELLDKHPDIAELVPDRMRAAAERKASENQQRQQREDRRRQQQEDREREERERPEFRTNHSRPITCVTVSDDGKFLFTSSKDKLVLCWSMRERMLKCICTIAGHQGALWAVDVMGPRLISGGADGKVNLWAADQACKPKGAEYVMSNPLATLDHGGIVRVLRWCPFDSDSESQRFATGSEKFGQTPPAIAVWSVTGRSRIERVTSMSDKLPGKANDIQWGGGGKTKLFTAHDNGYVGIWLAEDLSLLKRLHLHKGPVTSFTLSDDGFTLVTASKDKSAAAVDVSQPSCEEVARYKANRPLNAVVVTPDYEAGTAGNIILAGGKDERDVTTEKTRDDEFDSFILESESGRPVAQGSGHFGPVHAMCFLPNLGRNGAYASVSEDGCVRVHSIEGRLLHADTVE